MRTLRVPFPYVSYLRVERKRPACRGRGPGARRNRRTTWRRSPHSRTWKIPSSHWRHSLWSFSPSPRPTATWQAVSKTMAKQHVAVPLLQRVHSSAGALALRRPTTIGGIECDVLLPGPPPPRDVIRLAPPTDEQQDRYPLWAPTTGWPGVGGWHEDTEWGRIHEPAR